MRFVIKASTLVEKCYLKVHQYGVEYLKTAALGSKRQFQFSQIDCVLMSPGYMLSFQVGHEIFSIQTKPYRQADQDAVRALLEGVRQGFVRM
ncbi:MAG TPA: hypothetical protein VM223_26640 [Planctomycetota bacterium]|nr:hypothetical protein [Planctomycetota bacterium]